MHSLYLTGFARALRYRYISATRLNASAEIRFSEEDDSLNSKEVVDYIRERVENGRDRQYGEEPVSEYEHALQCATLAERDGADEELVVAAFLHDFGRLIADDDELSDSVEHDVGDGVQRRGHGDVGASALKPFFSDRILFCVGQHAESKRYLCTTEPEYRNGLSTTSITTLEKQGGMMSDSEVAAFESSPFVTDAVRVRRWDDGGKVPGMQTKSLDHFLELTNKQFKGSNA